MKLLLFTLLVYSIATSALRYEDYLSSIGAQLDLAHDEHPASRRLHEQSKKAQAKSLHKNQQKSKKILKSRKAKEQVQTSKSKKAKKSTSHSTRKLAKDQSKAGNKNGSPKKIAEAWKHNRHQRKLDGSSTPLTDILDPVADQVNNVPNLLGFEPAKDRQDKYLSALGTTLLGYGLYNNHMRAKDFEVFRRKLFTNLMNREMYLDSVSNQISQMHDVEMALNKCKNKAREVQELFNHVVLENIRPGTGLY
jgi:hypothetical protein